MNKKTPFALAEALGERLQQTRLNRNFTQADVAKVAGVSRKTVLNAEKGQAQLSNFIAIMVALDVTDQLDLLLPAPGISPIQLAKLQGKQRQRASGLRGGGLVGSYQRESDTKDKTQALQVAEERQPW